MSPHEVKGIWFVTARAEITESFGPEALEALIESVPVTHRGALADPLPSAWYAEETLQVCLQGFRRELARGSQARFGELLERCTARGVGRFFSALMRVSTPAFLLGQVPTMWKRIRRGPGYVEVAHDDDGTLLRYRSFPFFADPIYEELTVSSVRSILTTCTGAAPEVFAERVGDDELDLRARYRA